MKLQIAICDDMADERTLLAGLVYDYCDQHNMQADIHLFSDGNELMDSFVPGRMHIIFLDIYMPGLSGMDTARLIREKDASCAIIFATTSQEHGMDSYDVQASDYLVKPFVYADVEDALDWCVNQARSLHRALEVYVEDKTVPVLLRDICYVEIRGHNAHLHTQSGVLVIRQGLDDLEREIDHEDFLRCHRSFLVNMNYIQWMEKNSFLLIGGEEVPIGSTVVGRVRDAYMKWSFVKSWEQK